MSLSYALAAKDFKTILDFLRFGITQAEEAGLFYGHGTDNAWDEIHALILGLLFLPSDVDPLWFGSALTVDEKAKLIHGLERRIQERVPVPYITHTAYFCDLPFYVDERVLIPRSPLAELIKQQFSPWLAASHVHRILDLCTGSGCIAIACAYAFPDAVVDAVDISKEALQVARRNRERHGLASVLHLIESDGMEALGEVMYDLIVCNPPYVSSEEMSTLPEEYRHEPVLALEAAKQGMALVETILEQAGRHLSPHGIIVMEVGHSEEALLSLYPEVPFTWVDLEQGGQGIFVLTAAEVHHYF